MSIYWKEMYLEILLQLQNADIDVIETTYLSLSAPPVRQVPNKWMSQDIWCFWCERQKP